ncbi:hypothetical protein JIR001_22300 [Polycladomyces abyssicola]|uniref:Uncharacterized protein n=1 Tax=Polycladomyces abyssicola TaxID=1125966 RepID=A0A8D5UID1_9BACL|nr:hypothetical protein JIR001_22300 [Polycladomyces abyssicola]
MQWFHSEGLHGQPSYLNTEIVTYQSGFVNISVSQVASVAISCYLVIMSERESSALQGWDESERRTQNGQSDTDKGEEEEE